MKRQNSERTKGIKYLETIEPLKEQIVNEKDKVLFDEILACYKGKALRAAYIMTWISIVESLKQKFNEMAIRDSQVEKFVAEIKEKEEKEKPVDKNILDNAKKYGLISAVEYEKLDNIRKMRNIYAHPYQVGPSPEEVIAAIKIAVESVLSKPPLLRYGYVREVIDSLVKEFHYIDDDEQKIREFARNIAYKIHPETYPYIFRTSCEHLEFLIKEPALSRFVRRLLIFIDELFEEINLDRIDERWKFIELCKKFPNGCALLISTTRIWKLAPEQIQDMVIGYLLEPVSEGKIHPPTTFGLRIVFSLHNKGLLTDSQQKKFFNIINKKEVSYHTLIQAEIPLKFYVNKILEDLKSYTWPLQNSAGVALSNIDAHQFFDLSDEQQEELGRNVLQASEGNAFDVIDFLNKVSKAPHQYPKAFLKGIFFETLFNENTQLRMKNKHFDTALKCILNCKEETCLEVLREAEEKLRIAQPKDGYASFWLKDDLIKTIEMLENVIQSVNKESVKKLLSGIRTALETQLQKCKNREIDDEDF